MNAKNERLIVEVRRWRSGEARARKKWVASGGVECEITGSSLWKKKQQQQQPCLCLWSEAEGSEGDKMLPRPFFIFIYPSFLWITIFVLFFHIITHLPFSKITPHHKQTDTCLRVWDSVTELPQKFKIFLKKKIHMLMQKKFLVIDFLFLYVHTNYFPVPSGRRSSRPVTEDRGIAKGDVVVGLVGE